MIEFISPWDCDTHTWVSAVTVLRATYMDNLHLLRGVTFFAVFCCVFFSLNCMISSTLGSNLLEQNYVHIYLYFVCPAVEVSAHHWEYDLLMW